MCYNRLDPTTWPTCPFNRVTPEWAPPIGISWKGRRIRMARALILRLLVISVVLAGYNAMVTPTSRAATPSPSQPKVQSLDASGCNGDTCIYVTSMGGTGTYVTQIEASSKQAGPYQCAKVSLIVNNIVVTTDNAACANGFIHFFSKPWVPREYNSGTKLCVSATWGTGNPCETVHS